MSDIIEDHVDDNDAPPYDREEYPGTRQNMPAEVSVAEGRLAQKASPTASGRMPAFEAPLGLIRLEVDADADLDELVVWASMDTEIIGAC